MWLFKFLQDDVDLRVVKDFRRRGLYRFKSFRDRLSLDLYIARPTQMNVTTRLNRHRLVKVGRNGKRHLQSVAAPHKVSWAFFEDWVAAHCSGIRGFQSTDDFLDLSLIFRL